MRPMTKPGAPATAETEPKKAKGGRVRGHTRRQKLCQDKQGLARLNKDGDSARNVTTVAIDGDKPTAT